MGDRHEADHEKIRRHGKSHVMPDDERGHRHWLYRHDLVALLDEDPRLRKVEAAVEAFRSAVWSYRDWPSEIMEELPANVAAAIERLFGLCKDNGGEDATS